MHKGFLIVLVATTLSACTPAMVENTTTSSTSTTTTSTSTTTTSTTTTTTSTTTTTTTTLPTTTTTVPPTTTTTRPRPTTTTTTLPPPVFNWAGGESGVFGESGPLRTYMVGVEEGIDLDPAQIAAIVDGILGDERSWTSVLDVRLQRVSSSPNVRVVIATPATVDRLCAPLPTKGEVSCSRNGRVVLNVKRWTQGAATWGDDVTGYRGYLVNHEFGHFLGRQHVSCPGAGLPAPVMVQQTISLQGCLPNAWPSTTGG